MIDGKTAAATDSYPDVGVKHTLRVCNYNTVNSIKLVQAPKPAKTEFFYPVAGTDTKIFIVDESYNGHLLSPGECREEIATTAVSTRRAKYFMKAILQGPQKTASGAPVNDSFCYAYSFNKIDFKYDYGLGECKVEVSIYAKQYAYTSMGVAFISSMNLWMRI